MSDLTAAIDAFLAKYPDDAVLTWQQRRRKPNALDVMVTDLLIAADRMTTNPAAAVAAREHVSTSEEIEHG